MIFQKIVDCDFEKSVDQIFLYTYRAFALEYHRHQEGARMGEIMFTKKPSLVNMEDEDNGESHDKIAYVCITDGYNCHISLSLYA